MTSRERLAELMPLVIAVCGLAITIAMQAGEIATLKDQVKTLQVEVQSIEFVKKWGEHERTVDR